MKANVARKVECFGDEKQHDFEFFRHPMSSRLARASSAFTYEIGSVLDRRSPMIVGEGNSLHERPQIHEEPLSKNRQIITARSDTNHHNDNHQQLQGVYLPLYHTSMALVDTTPYIP